AGRRSRGLTGSGAPTVLIQNHLSVSTSTNLAANRRGHPLMPAGSGGQDRSIRPIKNLTVLRRAEPPAMPHGAAGVRPPPPRGGAVAGRFRSRGVLTIETRHIVLLG